VIPTPAAGTPGRRGVRVVIIGKCRKNRGECRDDCVGRTGASGSAGGRRRDMGGHDP
jgi:hypothetical protein